MLEVLDRTTKYRYNNTITTSIKKNQLHILELENRYKEILAKEYRDVFKMLSIRKKIKVRLGAISPKLLKLLGK